MLISAGKSLAILGIHGNPTAQKIRRAYRRKAFLYHPDRNNSPQANQQFIRIAEAYEYLTQNLGSHGFQQEKDNWAGDVGSLYQEYETTRAQTWKEAMDRARKSYQDFLSKNADYRKRWFYLPLKVMAYLVFLLIIVCGLGLMIVPLIGLIYTGNFMLIIFYVPLLLLGVMVIYLAFIYKIRIAPYFFEDSQTFRKAKEKSCAPSPGTL